MASGNSPILAPWREKSLKGKDDFHSRHKYKYKAIRWKIALGCFDYFFHLISIIITKYFN